MPIAEVPPLNPLDERVPHTMDFSDILGPENDTIASITSIIAVPNSIVVGAGNVVDGTKSGCAVQFTLGLGVDGLVYTVTVNILTTNGVERARSMFVPVNGI